MLSTALDNRFAAFLAGGVRTAAMLESSTTTGIMTASFAAEGLVVPLPALAIMLGANVGTTRIVQLYCFQYRLWRLCFSWPASLRSRRRQLDPGCRADGERSRALAVHVLIDTPTPAEEATHSQNLPEAIAV